MNELEHGFFTGDGLAFCASKCEWKLTLESVLLEHRAGLYDKAARSGKLALGHHGTTGRLWAVVIQQL